MRRFADVMVALRERAEAPGGSVPVAEILDAVLNETGYLDALRAERTIDAYARGLAEYLLVCERDDRRLQLRR